MKKVFILSGVVLALGVASACVDETETDAVTEAKKNIECVYNSDCPKGLVCGQYSGRCEQCFLNSQCPEGQKCSPAGECVAECKTDRDCSSGTCEKGVCTGSVVGGEDIGEIEIPNIEDFFEGGSTGYDWLDEILQEIFGSGRPGIPPWYEDDDDWYEDDDEEEWESGRGRRDAG